MSVISLLNGPILKIALVTNTLAPYRNPVFSEIAKCSNVQLLVLCCSKMEPNRHWDLPPIDFDCHFLHQRIIQLHDRYIHNNPDVISALSAFKPDIVVNDGLNPTHLYAFVYARRKKIPHVYMTDGTQISENTLTFLHRLVRQYVFNHSQAYIAASDGGLALFKQYRLSEKRVFKSCLCVNNQAFGMPQADSTTHYDLMFCGRFEPVKNPFFAIEVAVRVAKKMGRRISLLFVGSGSLEEKLRHCAELFPGLLSLTVFGHAQQHQLPALYRSASVFLFPSLWDPWGVVVNEACASGLPVLASPFAGVANELVRDNQNGYVCELEPDLWVQRVCKLLEQSALRDEFAANSVELVAAYTFKSAADGVVQACQFALDEAQAQNQEPHRNERRPRVLVVERQLLQYRADFYHQLRAALEQAGIELQLLTGKGTPQEAAKKNEVTLDWSVEIPTYYVPGTSLCWQPFARHAKEADLVIVMHENKILYNLWLLSFGRPKRLAFWGHGRNMQSSNPNGLKERFKRWTINKVDWWFTYTQSGADLVQLAGFPQQQTTVVQNAVDTESLANLCATISSAQMAETRTQLGLPSHPVGLYLGSLYKEKRIDFLIEAACRIQQQIPDFHLIVAGAGPEQYLVEDAAQRYPWIHYVGPVSGQDKAMMLRLADIILNPGLVGLGVLDSFASGKPMLTTDCGLHSPEISYLETGYNGLMVANKLDDYAQAAISLLNNPIALQALSNGAKTSAAQYTIHNMVHRTQAGIRACLAN